MMFSTQAAGAGGQNDSEWGDHHHRSTSPPPRYTAYSSFAATSPSTTRSPWSTAALEPRSSSICMRACMYVAVSSAEHLLPLPGTTVVAAVEQALRMHCSMASKSFRQVSTYDPSVIAVVSAATLSSFFVCVSFFIFFLQLSALLFFQFLSLPFFF